MHLVRNWATRLNLIWSKWSLRHLIGPRRSLLHLIRYHRALLNLIWSWWTLRNLIWTNLLTRLNLIWTHRTLRHLYVTWRNWTALLHWNRAMMSCRRLHRRLLLHLGHLSRCNSPTVLGSLVRHSYYHLALRSNIHLSRRAWHHLAHRSLHHLARMRLRWNWGMRTLRSLLIRRSRRCGYNRTTG